MKGAGPQRRIPCWGPLPNVLNHVLGLPGGHGDDSVLGVCMKRSGFLQQVVRRALRPADHVLVVVLLLWGLVALSGCRSPAKYREKADEVAYDIMAQKQQEALGKTEPFRIERPSDILRRRLIEEQGLAVSSAASLGTDELQPIPHWPEEGYPSAVSSVDGNIPVEPDQSLKISLIDALQIAARNSPDYQSRKEDVFRVALDLDLERNAFRTIFTTAADSRLTMDTTGDETVTTVANGGTVGVTRVLKNGLAISSALALDVFNLLTQGGASSLGLASDTSVSLPLLRGAGRHIVTEPLTQAERDVIYEMWDFERFKRTFAVDIAQRYYAVLRQMDSLKNSENNYRSAIQSARWSRRQADAGRIPEIQVDQAVQRELSSRNNWISSQQGLKDSLDLFKALLGLPPDALVTLDPNDLVQLRQRAEEYVETMRAASKAGTTEEVPPADAPVTLVPPSKEEAGPYEIDGSLAVHLALENRLDLRVANGSVYDAQRQVVVAADTLRPELTLSGSASFADEAFFGDDVSDDSLHFEGGRYSALLALDLPIDPRTRTRERNLYRTSLINLERATRAVQDLEDQIKLSIRSELRTLLESRESLKIQAQSVVVAEKRVRSATLFLEAGRAEIRDLLEAQDALLAAQNSLTAAVVSYRTAELQFQRDLGLLTITKEGLWEEFSPEGFEHDGQQQS
jgi:outer membrane protein TolC